MTDAKVSDWRDEIEGNLEFWLLQDSDGIVRVAYDEPPIFACGPSVHVVRATERDQLLAKVAELESELQHEREISARLSEALEFYSLEHEHWKSSIFEQNKAKEALDWLKKRREGNE